jgi:hypothetical protein
VPMPPVDPGVERSRVNIGKLQLALAVAMAREGLNQNDVARQTGINGGRLSEFRRHGKPLSDGSALALLGWLHIDPALVMDPAERKPARTRTADAAAA